MRGDEVRARLGAFIALLTVDPPPSLDRLAHSLDDLALLVHETPEGAPADSNLEPPEAEFKDTYDVLAARFPDFGFYPVADPLSAPGEEQMLGDAIDDLADIVGDLREVIWRYENLGQADAFWHLHDLYRIHWGRHLRDLSGYVHAKRFG